MNNDLSSYFEDPEFKDLLAKYEGMVESHTPTYFDAEELTDIAEYYASQGDERKAEDAIDFALRLHPTNTDALVFKIALPLHQRQARRGLPSHEPHRRHFGP